MPAKNCVKQALPHRYRPKWSKNVWKGLIYTISEMPLSLFPITKQII